LKPDCNLNRQQRCGRQPYSKQADRANQAPKPFDRVWSSALKIRGVRNNRLLKDDPTHSDKKGYCTKRKEERVGLGASSIATGNQEWN